MRLGGIRSGQTGLSVENFCNFGASRGSGGGGPRLELCPNWAKATFVPRGTFPISVPVPKLFHVEQNQPPPPIPHAPFGLLSRPPQRPFQSLSNIMPEPVARRLQRANPPLTKSAVNAKRYNSLRFKPTPNTVVLSCPAVLCRHQPSRSPRPYQPHLASERKDSHGNPQRLHLQNCKTHR